MAKAPVMPLFTDALIGDTTHLSVSEFGAYLLIMIATWRNNGQPLPDDNVRLARTCRIRVDTWSRFYRGVLVKFFDVSDGSWRQKRLEKEWSKISSSLGSKLLISSTDDNDSHQKSFENKRVVVHQNHDTFNVRSLGSNVLKSKKTGSQRARASISISIKKKNLTSSVLPPSARAHELREAAPRTRDTVAIATQEEAWRSLGSVLGQSNAVPPPPDEDRRRHEQMPTHLDFLRTHGAPGELDLYIAAQMSDDPDAARRMFDLTEARMP